MLVLSRKEGEIIRIGDDIWVQVETINERFVNLRFIAPHEIKILRKELLSMDAGTTPATTQDPEQDAPGAQGETK